MTIHTLEPKQGTVHGHFSVDLPPVLTISSGDTVRFKTLDAGFGLEPFSEDGTRRRFEPNELGHALCGPVAIEGAEPGKTLEVRVNHIRPGLWGYTRAGGFDHPVNRRLGLVDAATCLLNWTIDPERMMATSQFGHRVALRPFMGLMGMPPAEVGKHPTHPPRFCGGNIDCKELIAGSSLFLPIAVAGGLFSVGDGHGVQGNGEVAVPALECPMDEVDLTFIVHDEMRLSMPRAKTPTHWISFGFHEDLNEATMMALDGMLDLMQEQFGYSRAEALALASLVVDLQVTQIVNGVKGVHAMLAHGALR
ncbi:acetamidase/formamidase family protein [Ferroacidibacillus organovorans]|uniref:Acetamidase n=1 Tax=Ferroacidibacillus organovorans TaxID=1765683 RepID=A0A162RUJ1_9BACL|nr:acetamidase/formamidase family protein [Ferroacidibacillus organovorans]KYP79269.1 acetamidase [Ferroacidibacillus organovorans]OAG95285.1 acetamidase [Ferroacidibacillus organovorans]OPG17170.1 acetamidase [Ferroacidibacillus organovorans]